MNGKYQYRRLSELYPPSFLMDAGVKNGLSWNISDESEGINWMRFSSVLIAHLEEDKDFEVDDVEPEVLSQMLDLYEQLRGLHKQSMVPHIKAVMLKLGGEETATPPEELLPKVYQYMEDKGGKIWSDKLSAMNHCNRMIRKIKGKLEKIGM